MILITENGANKITLNGLGTELTSVVARLGFAGLPNGKKIQVAFEVYASEAAYNAGQIPITVSGFETSSKYYDLALGTTPETYAEQSNLVAHEKVVADLTAQGYLATIIGL